MPRNARCVVPGLPYHVTQRGTNRQRVFFCASDFKTYLSLVREQLADTETRVLAYCLMTNHVHLVVVPERADSLAILFRRVHGRYAQYLNTRRRRTGHHVAAALFLLRSVGKPSLDRHPVRRTESLPRADGEIA
jgi:putative transposase